ncbi:MAG: four helix bundle protein [bacterium]|nr:four helix bundle protein [bacterium]
MGPKLAKRDRYGIYLKIESLCLDGLTLSIEAALLPRQRKTTTLETLKIKIELLKQLIRMAHEIQVIEQSRYIAISADLIEASKMTSGWLTYIHANSP